MRNSSLNNPAVLAAYAAQNGSGQPSRSIEPGERQALRAENKAYRLRALQAEEQTTALTAEVSMLRFELSKLNRDSRANCKLVEEVHREMRIVIKALEAAGIPDPRIGGAK